jgi:hypothetical protein
MRTKISSLEKHRKRARRAQVKKWQSQMRYCGRGLPRYPLPAGFFLVHNHIKPQPWLGVKGFRGWVQKGSDDLVECDCDFGGIKNATVQKRHFKVRGLEQVEHDLIWGASFDLRSTRARLLPLISTETNISISGHRYGWGYL